MNIAIIPARGGSKRIPRKNIKVFSGKPMIAHAIDIALRSKLFDQIVVTTDDDEIASIAKQYGAQVPFKRPAELSDDHTTTLPVIAHAITVCQKLGGTIDGVCCIYPCVPFMKEADLSAGLNKLVQTKKDFVFPITTFPSAIQRALRQLSNGNIVPFYPEFTTTRTQDLETAYYDAGQFYWGRALSWLEGKVVHQNGIGLEIPSWRVVDIDTLDDWQRAELMYESFNQRIIESSDI